MNKYIVTGGAGFIGSHVVERLLKEKCEVVVVDNFCSGHREFLPDSPNLQVVEADIGNWGELTKQSSYFKGAAGVFHLAACARIQPSIRAPHRTHESNVTGTLNVLELMRMVGIDSIVYSASSSSYGKFPDLPCEETAQHDCQTPYAISKHMGELYCKTWSKLHGIKSVCLKYFNVYGRRSPLQGPYSPVIGLFLKQALTDQPLTIVGKGTQKRDFTHVLDVVRANILAMQKIDKFRGTTINIGTGENYSINEIADLVKTSVGKVKKVTTTNVPARVGETQETLADNTRASEMLGWAPEIDLASGIKDMTTYYLNNIEKFKEKDPVL